MSPHREGFWYSVSEPHLPTPITTEQSVSEKFLEKLKAVSEHLSMNGKIKKYKGSSLCRLCGCKNGSMEYRSDQCIYPQGFQHYLTFHNVHPSQQFISIIEQLYEDLRAVS